MTNTINTSVAAAKTVSLSEGLDFTNGANTTAIVEDKGVVKYNLNDDIKLTYVTTGNTKMSTDGIVISSSPEKTVSLLSTGLNNGGNKITNIAAGTADTDAVNVSQLKSAKTEVTSEDNSLTVKESTGNNGQKIYDLSVDTSKTDKQINNIRRDIIDLEDDLNHVGSLSAAMSGLHPMQYDPKRPNQIMAAVGHYRDTQSVAVGSRITSQKT